MFQTIGSRRVAGAKLEITDNRLMILMGVRDKKTLRTIAAEIHKSLRTVQNELEELEMDGLVNKPERLMKTGRTLTTKGKEVLANAGYKTE